MSSIAERDTLNVSRGAVLVVVYICSLPALVLNFFPLLVSAMVTSFGLSEQQSGFIASTDMAGYTIGAAAAFLLIHKVDWRKLTGFSLLLMVIANLVCSQLDQFLSLLSLRFLSGLGGGLVTAAMLSVIAQMRNPEAIYGLWFAVLSLITIVGMALFPRLLETAGLGAAFIALAAMVSVCLPFLNALPHGAARTNAESAATVNNSSAAIPVVIAIFVLTTGIGSAWAFLGQIGAAAGLGVEQVSYAVAVSAAGGVIGGMAAGWLHVRLGRAFPVSLSCTGLVVTMLLLMLDDLSYLLFILCSLAFYGLWSFVIPYLLGALAEFERSGRALSLGCTAQGTGFMVGPFVASLILYRGGYGAVLVFAAASVVVCLVLYLAGGRKLRVRYGEGENARCSARRTGGTTPRARAATPPTAAIRRWKKANSPTSSTCSASSGINP